MLLLTTKFTGNCEALRHFPDPSHDTPAATAESPTCSILNTVKSDNAPANPPRGRPTDKQLIRVYKLVIKDRGKKKVSGEGE